MCSSTMLCAHSPIALWNSTSIAASSWKSPRLVRLLHARHDLAEQRAVVVGGAPRRKFGGDGLDRAAVFQIVGGRLAVRGDQLHHRLRENLADHVGDIGAAAVPRDDQAALLQRFSASRRIGRDTSNWRASSRSRRQPVGDAQHAFEDEVLDLLHDLVGGAHMLDPGKNLAQFGSGRCARSSRRI